MRLFCKNCNRNTTSYLFALVNLYINSIKFGVSAIYCVFWSLSLCFKRTARRDAKTSVLPEGKSKVARHVVWLDWPHSSYLAVLITNRTWSHWLTPWHRLRTHQKYYPEPEDGDWKDRKHFDNLQCLKPYHEQSKSHYPSGLGYDFVLSYIVMSRYVTLWSVMLTGVSIH